MLQAQGERHALLVNPDSRGWNICRDPGYQYLESCGLYQQDAIARAHELAGELGLPVLVLNTTTHQYEEAPRVAS